MTPVKKDSVNSKDKNNKSLILDNQEKPINISKDNIKFNIDLKKKI